MVFNPKIFNGRHSGHTLQLDSTESSSIESVQCCPDYVVLSTEYREISLSGGTTGYSVIRKKEMSGSDEYGDYSFH
jgi:hypothetical protein